MSADVGTEFVESGDLGNMLELCLSNLEHRPKLLLALLCAFITCINYFLLSAGAKFLEPILSYDSFTSVANNSVWNSHLCLEDD
jgi:hypothetical protein